MSNLTNQEKLHAYYEKAHIEGHYDGSKSGMMKIQGLCYGRKNGDFKTISEYTVEELLMIINKQEKKIEENNKLFKDQGVSCRYLFEDATIKLIEVIKEEIAKREEETATEKETDSQKVKINHTFKIERNANKDMINVYDQDGNRLSTDVGDQYAWRSTTLSFVGDDMIRPYDIVVNSNGWDIYRNGYNREFVSGGYTLEGLCKYLNENNYYFRYISEDGE